MEFFERAHVTMKSSSTMESTSDEAVKKQLKQMMHAYRKGNNEGIRNSSEMKPKINLEESTSISDFTEFRMAKDSNNSVDTVTSSDKSPAVTSPNYSNSTSENTGSTEGSLDVTESSEAFKNLSSSSKDVYVTEKSDLIDSSSEVHLSESNDSELSLPSSLLISPSTTDLSDDEEFDADRTLASQILKNLGKKGNSSNKRKIVKDDIEIKKENEEKSKKKNLETVKKSKKLNKQAEQGSKQKIVNTFLTNSSVDRSGQTFQGFTEDIVNYQVVTESKKRTKLTQANQIIESSGDSMNESIDSVSTSFSSPFISISAEDMSCQSLTDVIGDYVYPTIRNLPTDNQNVIPTEIPSNMFPSDTMFVNDVDDEISSLIPEVDEELAIEDLILEPGTEGLIEDSIQTEETIPDNISEIYNADATIDTINTQLTEVEPMKLYYGKDNYVLVMKHPSQLYIHGKVQIGIINGVADIFGYKLNYDSIDVYAPYCYFAQCLKTLDNTQGSNPNLYSELSSVGLTKDDTTEIVSNIQDNTSVIILTKLTNRRISFVGNNFRATELFSKRVDKSPYFMKKAADNLECSFYLVPPKKNFEEKVVWSEVQSRNRETSRGIVCGGKGTGKSTFLRHYVNSLVGLGPVLVIDLDPGQAEFTPPGVLSATIVDRPLLGPNFTHLKAPELMLNIGIINTMDNATRYLSAVRDIITYCRTNEHFQDLPWIVNTMGLCNQMGLKFITYIILEVRPTFLLQIDSKTPKKRFEVELDPLTIAQMYQESYRADRSFGGIRDAHVNYNFVISRDDGVKGPGSVLQPRDERYLNILAYFGELLQDNRSRGLTELVPYEVYMKDLSVGLNVKIPDVPVARVINGKIIALCQQTAYDKGQVFTLGDNALLCHGHGLIRGIDYYKRIVYILTPTPIGKLSLVNTLVYSDWMPELRGQELDLPSGTTVPYRTANAEHHQRMLMFPPRRRFNPIQLLKMTRNT